MFTLFGLEVFVGGMLSGIMYSLVAIGFVLVYKSSGVFNFAQGTMLLFAALTFVSLTERQVNFWVAFAITCVVMVIMGIIIERTVMRPLANQDLLSLFMATVGVNYFLEGLAQGTWDSAVHGVELGVPTDPVFVSEIIPWLDILVSKFDGFAAAVALSLVIGLYLFFQYTRTGLSLRAVSDDHMASQAVGIPLTKIWAIVWAVTGVICFIAGLIWADRLSVSFTLTWAVLKGLPVILIGGLTSIPGCLVGGLIIGASEKLGEIFFADVFGGQGIEHWWAYLTALVFILIRPTGIFGERDIERI
ncbi:MAG: branched-chain amino acid ABC transporter permease [Gammaproteobacteria bacterium]|nr:branched-chain amino acid ABC transporter permease [Gammaproteobacteria bacterium]MDE0410942.1 branched-chain amino acid ABC transporter permease [Gammaproteobacteria bacterium]